MGSALTTNQTMEMLRTTVPRLAEPTDGVPQKHMYALTDYGWSVGHMRRILKSLNEDPP